MRNEPVPSAIGQLAGQLYPKSTKEIRVDSDSENPDDLEIARDYYELISHGEFPIGAFVYAYKFFLDAIKNLFEHYDNFEKGFIISVQHHDLLKIFSKDFPEEIESLLATETDVCKTGNLCALRDILNEDPEMVWPILIAAYKDATLIILQQARMRAQINAVVKADDVRDPAIGNGAEMQSLIIDLEVVAWNGGAEEEDDDGVSGFNKTTEK